MVTVNYIARGVGPTVIFLHGIGGGAESFSNQLDRFADAGYRAVAWNMPGYGGSAPQADMTFPALADALLGLFDGLSLDTAHVVGHSIGGMVLQQFARAHQTRLASMVLAQTSPAFGNPDGEFQQKFVAARLAPLEAGQTMAEVAVDVVSELVGDSTLPESVAFAESCMSKVPPDVYGATIHSLVTFEGRDALPDIQVPTLVLAGEQDTNAPAGMMERMASKIAGAEYVCLSSAGHLANIEVAEAFNWAVLDFISRHR